MRRDNTQEFFSRREVIESYYPSHIASTYHKMLAATTPKENVILATEVFQRLLEHCFSFVLATYIELCLRPKRFPREENVDSFLWQSYERISFGNMLRITRGLANHLEKHDGLGILKGMKDFNAASKYFNAMLEYRNKVAHDTIPVDLMDSITSNLLGCIDYCEFMKDLLIFTPSMQEGSDNYSGFLFIGSGTSPLYIQTKETNIKLNIHGTYLTSSEFRVFIPLEPFWKYVKDKKDDDAKNHLCFVNIKNKNALLIDHCDGYKVTNKLIAEEYSERIKILSPDYQYQRHSYLFGNRLLIKKRVDNLTITSNDGDLKTSIELEAQKIISDIKKSETTNSKPIEKEHTDEKEFFKKNLQQDIIRDEVLPFDYRDAPFYPIPDSLFNLQVTNDNNENLEITYDIKNDSFRKYSVVLPNMAFEEIRKVKMNCFEPMLFNSAMTENIDYYEIEIDIPTDEQTLILKLFPNMLFKKYAVKYLNGGTVNLKKHPDTNDFFKIANDENNCQTLSFTILKPKVGNILMLEFETDNYNQKIVNNTNDSFRTGLAIYNLLNKQKDLNWNIETKEDGTIIIRPIKISFKKLTL